MSFESFTHVPISDAVLAHIWEGEPGELNQGGHRYGLGRDGKTEFPEHWDLDVVRAAIRSTLDRPEGVFFRGSTVNCARVVGGVLVRVRMKIERGVLSVQTAYPAGGPGVVMNVRGKQVSLPLDLSKLEA